MAGNALQTLESKQEQQQQPQQQLVLGEAHTAEILMVQAKAATWQQGQQKKLHRKQEQQS